MGNNITLQQRLALLSTDELMELYNNLLNAGIGHEYGRNTKAVFKRLKKISKGNMKKIYTALAKSSNDELEQIFNRLVEL